MENYFQAEAFNLDKVLDEFEQNEGELLSDKTRTDSESLCSRKEGWDCGFRGAVVRMPS